MSQNTVRALRVLGQLLLLPLLTLDGLANCICGGSIRNTLSGEAWHARDNFWWRWTHRLIDALFFWQAGHCKGAAMREIDFGSWLAAWWYDTTKA